LAWLAQQPEVNPNHLVVQGILRGSEAALLLGVNYPELVHAVIARVTNNVALCGLKGHGVGIADPYVPNYFVQFGGMEAATALAQIDFWPHGLAFLAAIP
jgi:hypothetical protein